MHCNEAWRFPFGAHWKTVMFGVHHAPILDSGEFRAGATMITTHVVAWASRRIRALPLDARHLRCEPDNCELTETVRAGTSEIDQ